MITASQYITENTANKEVCVLTELRKIFWKQLNARSPKRRRMQHLLEDTKKRKILWSVYVSQKDFNSALKKI